MSQEALDVRTSTRIVWRHKILVGIFAALGLLLGTGYTLRYPPMPASEALVVLPSSVHNIATHVVIAGSDPVLSRALGSGYGGMSREQLHRLIHVRSLTSNVISITARGKTARQAEDIANAVASSYVGYVSPATSPVGPVSAQILQRATSATQTALPIRLLQLGGAGLLAGALVGAIIALAISRGDRRMRERDQIAHSAGVSVLASISVAHPSDAASWIALFKGHESRSAEAWRLRSVLQRLGLDPSSANGDGCGSSLAVLSLSSDRKALALGPQLAVFAASLGIRTALVISAPDNTKATAVLRTACAAAQPSFKGSGKLLLTSSDHDGASQSPPVKLTVVVGVIDGRTPQFTDTLPTTATLLGVSAGAATAEELARVTACAAADGRQIAGILVADPSSADHTTGRLLQSGRPTRQATPAGTRARTETKR